jgi:hypothetical protein
MISYGGPYEATDPGGTVWRLSLAEGGWLLAPRDEPDKAEFITGEHGLYHALDMAGLRIAGDAVRADPDGARRQLGLEDG